MQELCNISSGHTQPVDCGFSSQAAPIHPSHGCSPAALHSIPQYYHSLSRVCVPVCGCINMRKVDLIVNSRVYWSAGQHNSFFLLNDPPSVWLSLLYYTKSTFNSKHHCTTYVVYLIRTQKKKQSKMTCYGFMGDSCLATCKDFLETGSKQLY